MRQAYKTFWQGKFNLILRHKTYSWKKNLTASIQHKRRFDFFFSCAFVAPTSGSCFMLPVMCKLANKQVGKTAGPQFWWVIFFRFKTVFILFKLKLFTFYFVFLIRAIVGYWRVQLLLKPFSSSTLEDGPNFTLFIWNPCILCGHTVFSLSITTFINMFLVLNVRG